MRDVTAQLERYQHHLDELYPSVGMSDIDLATTQARRPAGWKRRTFAFVGAFAVVVTAVVLASLTFTDSDTSDPVTVITTPAPTATLPVEVTTTSPTSTIPPTTAPEIPTAVGTESFERLLENSGFSIASGVVGRDGNVVLAYWSDEEQAIMIARCLDPDCVEPAEVAVLVHLDMFMVEGDWQPPQIDDIAVLQDGSPVVTVWSADQTTHTIYVCRDADCSDSHAIPMATAPGAWHPKMAVAPNGLPYLIYEPPSGRHLQLAACADERCDPADWRFTEIQPDARVVSNPSIRFEPDGSLLIAYTTGDYGDINLGIEVAVCTDGSCEAESEFIRIENAVLPQVTTATDAQFNLWYRTPPWYIDEGDSRDPDAIFDELDLMVRTCEGNVCSEAVRVDAPWPLLDRWEEARLVALPNGHVVAAYPYWDLDRCAVNLDITIFDPTNGSAVTQLGHLAGGPILVADSTPTGSVVLVVLDELEGIIDVIHVSGTTQTASEPTPSGQCP